MYIPYSLVLYPAMPVGYPLMKYTVFEAKTGIRRRPSDCRRYSHWRCNRRGLRLVTVAAIAVYAAISSATVIRKLPQIQYIKCMV